MKDALNHAISLAAIAHDGQMDKAGQPYILHCLRVMLALDNEDDRIAGVLHDLFEDTTWTEAGLLRLGFEPTIVDALRVLTRASDEPYDAYLKRISKNKMAVRVKLADLRDNLRPGIDEYPALKQRYETALTKLQAV